MSVDFLQKKKDRLSRLRTLTEAPHGIDFDRVQNYFSRLTTRPSPTAYKIRREVFVSKRHHLVEELALTSQMLSRARKVLQPWEADLLERYDSTPDSELLAWIRAELGQTWDVPKLRRQILRIKKRLGANQEKVKRETVKPKTEKPRFLEMLNDSLEGFKNSIFPGKKR